MENIEINRLEYCPYCNANTQYDIVFPELIKKGQSDQEAAYQLSKSEFKYGYVDKRTFSI